MKQDESAVIIRILDGEEELFAVLIDRYKQGLYYHCLRYIRDPDEAQDVAHEAFIAAFLKLDQYQSDYRFSTWLYKIATNIAIMHLRKRRDLLIDETAVDRVLSTLPDSEQIALKHELHRAVDALPARYRSVIKMHYWQGKPYREIALRLGTSEGTIKSWMSRARRQLKEAIS